MKRFCFCFTACCALSASISLHAYETDGHYWTVLVVATMLKIPDARGIAFNAEYPDNVVNADGYITVGRFTYLYPKAQKIVHALTGGEPSYERELSVNMLLQAHTIAEKGRAAHRLGDSFAHTHDKTGHMYPHIIGHMFYGKQPDKIKNNPEKYLEYVRTLAKALGGSESSIDMTVFEYIANAGLSTDANVAVLKAEYNLLIGSPVFNITNSQITSTENYLSERLKKAENIFLTYQDVDGKGRISNTIVLPRLAHSTKKFPEPVGSAVANFITPKEIVRKGFYFSMAAGAAFGTIRSVDNRGSKTHIEGDGAMFDLQAGSAIKENLFLHATLSSKFIGAPAISGDKMNGVSSFNETLTGVGVTRYFRNNTFITGNVGLGKFYWGDMNNGTFYTDRGFSFQVKVGKEFWIAQNFLMGVSASYSRTALHNNSSTQPTSEKWRSSRIGFMITLTRLHKVVKSSVL